MNESDWLREVRIRGVLRKLSRQRVAGILQPGNWWVIERALDDDPDTQAALRTCHMRGWVDVLANAVPRQDLTPNGSPPSDLASARRDPVYRLTEAGWNVIHGTRWWVMATFLVALATLVATIVGIVIL